jgi:hypothetical protein
MCHTSVEQGELMAGGLNFGKLAAGVRETIPGGFMEELEVKLNLENVFMPVIPALVRLRQKDIEFEASPTRAT